MIITLSPGCEPEAVRTELGRLGLWFAELTDDTGGVYFTIEPHSQSFDAERVAAIPGVLRVAVSKSAHPLIDRQLKAVSVSGVTIGAGTPVLMAGPCAVESPEQIDRVAQRLATAGVPFLRGGTEKPRSSPYAFQGHGDVALEWLRSAADRNGLSVVTEALSEASVDAVAAHADLIQIGSRNMHNYALLKRVAAAQKPVLLKRGMAATIDEWLLGGEYLLLHGAPSVIFCERGVRGFDPKTRNILDLAGVALLAHVYRQPVIVDPSHAVGRRDLVLPLARAAIAAGAAGLLVETHDHPAEALSDGPQALEPEHFDRLVAELRAHGSVPRKTSAASRQLSAAAVPQRGAGRP